MDIVDDDFSGSSISNRRNLTPENGLTPDKKRARSGGVGKRLRTASDLETGGWIDKLQKEAIKNLIMNGHEGLIEALDRYASGDGTDLLQFIANDLNETYERTKDMDIMEDLDSEMQDGCKVISQPTHGNQNCGHYNCPYYRVDQIHFYSLCKL